ncbi:Vacuolar protein-sorting-associated protein 36 [Coemansia interrupta]|uniref:Vacuolar protein-sorting-associated protein 36 n=1 Tax=Coemansia interrupta TaxID=1126814 RepID=A0A9W8HJ14_9FUNG|nr:Vacuolar protein-sorting-associated protein 36 [Coemansia interrupta]
MEAAELGPTQRPLLRSGEKIICIQNKVGLYQGAERDLEHDCGTMYLTSQRVFYVDQERPRERSVMVWLQAIQRCTLHSGFLYTSSKIHVHLRATAERQDAAGSSSSSGGSGAAGADPAGGEWTCTICEHANRGTSKCALCGVVRQHDDSDSGGRAGSDQKAVRCPACTFDNHASMARCEMCDSPLAPGGGLDATTDGGATEGTCSNEYPRLRTAEQAKAHRTSDDTLTLIKLSFRGGGATAFFPALREAVSNAVWLVVGFEDSGVTAAAPGTVTTVPSQQQQQQPLATRRPTAGGISTIVSAAHESSRARDVTLRSAFSDLDALTEKANEIVSMAEHIATQLNAPAASKLRGGGGSSSSSDEDSAARADAFRQYVLDLGIDSPVTRDTAGAVFHDELARELCDYLENYVSQRGGSVALVDAYCLYNRAREFALVYPADFVQACGKFEALQLPLRLRTYPSGLLALEDAAGAGDARVVERVAAYVRSFGPLMATDLAAFDDCPVTLAEERLWLCERAGELCRDESVEGVRFHINAFRRREDDGVY